MKLMRSSLSFLTAIILSLVAASISTDTASAQVVEGPELPSVVDQHGIKLSTGRISYRFRQGRIGTSREELRRSQLLFKDGFTGSSSSRENLVDNAISFNDDLALFSIAAEEVEDKFHYNDTTHEFEPYDATLSTLENVSGTNVFTQFVYTPPSGAIYTYDIDPEYDDYEYEFFEGMVEDIAILTKIEFPDGEIWTNNGGQNGFRSNNLGYAFYPYLINLGYTWCDSSVCSEYNQSDWPGGHHHTYPTDVRGQDAPPQYYFDSQTQSWLPIPQKSYDLTRTFSNGDSLKFNFDISDVTQPFSSRVESVERYGSTWNYDYTGFSAVTSTTVTAPSGEKQKYYFSGGVYHGLIYRHDQIPSGGGTTFTTSYGYTSGRLSSVTYPEGNRTELNRDTWGRVEEVRSVAKPGSSLADMVVTYTYDACTAANRKYCAKPRTETDERGKITKFKYSAAHGGITEVQHPHVAGEGYRKTNTEYAQFNAWYRTSSSATQIKDNRAVWRKTKELSCVVSTESATCGDGGADVQVTEYHYEQGNATTPSNIKLTQTITRSGDSSVSSSVTYEYDTWGRLKAEDGPLAGTSDKVWYEYDDRDNLLRTTTADPDGGGPQRYSYERRTYNPENQVTLVERGWTTSENPSTRTDTILTSELHEYDSDGRPWKVTSRDENNSAVSLSQTSYDSSSRVDCVALRMDLSSYGSLPANACTQTNSSDPTDRIAKTHYDSYSRGYKSTFGLGTSVEMSEERSFTSNGLKKTVQDGNGNVTTYMYDGLDRLYETQFPNKTGGGSSTTDKIGLTYLVSGGLSTPLVQHEYKRSHYQGTTAQVTYSYDERGRETLANATGTTNDVTITYDDFGNVETLIRNGKAVTYDWDALGRLKSETTTIAGQSFIVSYLYDAAGRRTRMTYPDSAYVTYEYWGSGGLKYIKESGTNTVASYEYDAFGRGKKLTFGNGVYRELDYDDANRVSDLDITVPSDTGYNQQIDYEFNAASQITSKIVQNDMYLPTDNGDSSDYSVNGLNQLTDETSNGSTLNIDYDKNGNLTDDGVTTYGYDLFNRLTSVSGGTTLDYDAAGRLYSMVTSSDNTYFLYDGKALIGEYSVSGSTVNLQRRYLHGLDVDTPIMWYEGSGISNSTRRYLVRDELGSVALVTEDNGDALHHNVYDEYGVPGTSNAGRFQYTGQTWLEEAGLYYYKARVYNPYLGRFHQTDPIGYDDGLNLYAYVSNDPTNSIDPSGKIAWNIVGAVFGAVVQTAVEISNGSFQDGLGEGLKATGRILVSTAAGATGGTLATNAARLTTVTGRVATNTLGSGAIGASASVSNQMITNGDVSIQQVGKDAATGAALGAVGSVAGETVEAIGRARVAQNHNNAGADVRRLGHTVADMNNSVVNSGQHASRPWVTGANAISTSVSNSSPALEGGGEGLRDSNTECSSSASSSGEPDCQ